MSTLFVKNKESYNYEDAIREAIKVSSTHREKRSFNTSTDSKLEPLLSIGLLTIPSEDVTIEQLIPWVRSIISDRVAERIICLNQLALEGDLEGVLLSEKSLLNFLKFMQHNPDLPEPSIVLSSSGNVMARWVEHENKLLTIEFLPDSLVNFVLFSPLPNFQVTRLGGVTSPKSMQNIIMEYGISEWSSLWMVTQSHHRTV